MGEGALGEVNSAIKTIDPSTPASTAAIGLVMSYEASFKDVT